MDRCNVKEPIDIRIPKRLFVVLLIVVVIFLRLICFNQFRNNRCHEIICVSRVTDRQNGENLPICPLSDLDLLKTTKVTFYMHGSTGTRLDI